MYEEDIDFVLKRYKDLFGFDFSYMKFKVSPQPVYIDGRPCYEYDQDECAGDWTKLGWIRLNPDMLSVMRRYGIEGVSVDDFAKSIIAHELAHELYNKIANGEFIRRNILIAKKAGFTTPYLKTVRPNKLREETFCEWMAYRITDGVPHSSAAKPIDFPEDEIDDVKEIRLPEYAVEPVYGDIYQRVCIPKVSINNTEKQQDILLGPYA